MISRAGLLKGFLSPKYYPKGSITLISPYLFLPYTSVLGSRRSYAGTAPSRPSFTPSYAALLAIVSSMLGYGFARATGEASKSDDFKYGSKTEFALAERELRQAFLEGAISTDKDELEMYGSSNNS